MYLISKQKYLNHLTAEIPDKNRTIHLTDICFKPLEPDNENCTVFSVLQYYQNSFENLNKTIMDDEGFLMSLIMQHIF